MRDFLRSEDGNENVHAACARAWRESVLRDRAQRERERARQNRSAQQFITQGESAMATATFPDVPSLSYGDTVFLAKNVSPNAPLLPVPYLVVAAQGTVAKLLALHDPAGPQIDAHYSPTPRVGYFCLARWYSSRLSLPQMSQDEPG
jgi:hypothetical protein